MLRVYLKPSFVRQFDALPPELQEEAVEKIELFEDPKQHRSLRVHKLKGALAEKYSFSVNFRYRILFEYESKKVVVLLAIGDHDVYR